MTDGVLLHALFTRAAKLDPGLTARGAHGAKVIHRVVGISRQRNSGYRPNRVNIMAQGLSTSLSCSLPALIHTYLKREVAQQPHYTHH